MLAPDDAIFVMTSQGFFRYTIARTLIVDPTDVAVLASTSAHDHCSDQADYCCVIGEDSHHVRPPLELETDLLQRLVDENSL